MQQVSRIEQLDSLRGIAALSIVFLHFSSYLFPNTGEIISGYTPILRRTYLFVDMFFILSGFVLTLNYHNVFKELNVGKTYCKFLFKRLLRIYPLHFATLIILAFAHYFIYPLWPEIPQDEFQVIKNEFSLLTNFFLIHSSGLGDGGCYNCTSWNYPSWSISVEWLSYFFLPLGIFVGARGYKYLLLTSSISIVAVYTFIELRFNHLDVASYVGWIRCIAGMSFGVLLYQLGRIELRVTPKQLHLYLLGIPLILHLISSDTVVVIILGIGVFLVSKTRDRTILSHGVLQWLGERSYSIYLIHVIVQEGLSFFIRGYIGVIPRQLEFSLQLLLFGIGVCLTICLSHISFFLVEQRLTYALKRATRLISLSFSRYQPFVVK
ncbi:MAG: acyltransferase [Bacteriovoracaceae bacterium]|nr:acyltransferase [Bacteriovoracaceae bacterium]